MALSAEQKALAMDLALGRKQFDADLADAHGHSGREISDADLPEAERRALAAKKKAIDDFFGHKITAKYKIELTFGKGRSDKTAFAGAMHVYLSGSVLGGGGDEIVYPCPNTKCLGYIEPENRTSTGGLCPVCHKEWKTDKLEEGRLFKLSAARWAEVIAREYVRLGHDADIYLKSHPVDIRSKALLEQMKERRGEELWSARGARVPVMYPLNRLLKDLAAGADLEKRFLAFITA